MKWSILLREPVDLFSKNILMDIEINPLENKLNCSNPATENRLSRTQCSTQQWVSRTKSDTEKGLS